MFGKSKGEKMCPAGHVMEESWERCPYCEAERDAKVVSADPVVTQEGEGDAAPVDPGTGAVVVARRKVEAHPLAGWLVALSGAQEGEDFRVRHGRNVLGKAKEAAIVLKDPLASERHAVISVGTGKTIVADLDSKHGTHCNGEPVTEDRPLLDGDVIRIGTTELKFRTFEF